MMRLSPYLRKCRPWGWAWLLLFAVMFLGQLSAQDRSSSFDEMAAEAAAARDAEDNPRAIQLYAQVLQLNPKWEEGWWSLGLLQYGSGAFVPAIDALSHLLVLHPDVGQVLA